jgi:hypothetical protein
VVRMAASAFRVGPTGWPLWHDLRALPAPVSANSLPGLPARFPFAFILPRYTVALNSHASEPSQDLSTTDDVILTLAAVVPLWRQRLSVRA